jgi:hypothetical protein
MDLPHLRRKKIHHPKMMPKNKDNCSKVNLDLPYQNCLKRLIVFILIAMETALEFGT